MSTAWTITFDCADPAALAEEWGDGAYIEDPDSLRPGISFLKVPERKQDGVPDRFVMTDPEGNEFCVVWGAPESGVRGGLSVALVVAHLGEGRAE